MNTQKGLQGDLSEKYSQEILITGRNSWITTIGNDEMNKPFYCGTQYVDWQGRNCDKCRKFRYEGPADPKNCAIDYALGMAFWKDGQVSDEIAKRMGVPDDVRIYTWDCPEKAPKVTK